MPEGDLAYHLGEAKEAMEHAQELEKANLDAAEIVLAGEANMAMLLNEVQGNLILLKGQLDKVHKAEAAITMTTNEMLARGRDAAQRAQAGLDHCDQAHMVLDMTIGINQLDGLGSAITEEFARLQERLAAALEKVKDAQHAAQTATVHTLTDRHGNHAASLLELPLPEVVEDIQAVLEPPDTRLQNLRLLDLESPLRAARQRADEAIESLKAVIQ